MFDERICFGAIVEKDIFKAIEKIQKWGFSGIMNLVGGKGNYSLGEFPTFNWYELDDEEKEKLKEALKEFKHISLHQSWDENWKEWLNCAEFLKSEILTIHLGIFKKIFSSEFLRCIEEKNVKIGIENEGGSIKEYLNHIISIKHPLIGATLDTGHCAYFVEIETIENMEEKKKKLNEIIIFLIQELGEKLYHFHLHNVTEKENVDFSKIPHSYWENKDLVDHRCVAEGIISFKRIFKVLKKANYKGIFDIEIEEPETEEKAMLSGKFLTELLKEK